MRNEDGNENINFVIGLTMILFLVIIFITNGNTYKQIGQNKSSLINKNTANNYPMKISDMIDKRSWMNTCKKEIGSSVGGFSGKKVCRCLWDKLESPWYDANSQYETESAATLCLFEAMNETR